MRIVSRDSRCLYEDTREDDMERVSISRRVLYEDSIERLIVSMSLLERILEPVDEDSIERLSMCL